jgi:hypothetical protein
MADKGRRVIAKTNQVLERLVIEYAPIDSVHPNSYNPLYCRGTSESAGENGRSTDRLAGGTI